MSSQLGTMEELPPDYRAAMAAAGVGPLWPQMRRLLPHHAPVPTTRPRHWRYDELRPLLLRAGALTPVEKAERRVLFLMDPGRGPETMQATATIYVGLQLLLPGETAPAHKHTPSAARIVVEGQGGFTVVDGDKLPMAPGDLILTPGGSWHDHGHEGDEPVIWLDALDLPLLVQLEGSYAVEGALQPPRNRPDPSEVEFLAAGMSPPRRRLGPAPAYPMMRYPWARAEAALRRLAEHAGPGAVELDYVNPETGGSCLPTLGFTATLLRPGEIVRPPRRSSSAVLHVVSGAGRTTVDGASFDWTAKSVISAPVFAEITHEARGDEPAFLIRIHDQPLQERIGYYEERAR